MKTPKETQDLIKNLFADWLKSQEAALSTIFDQVARKAAPLIAEDVCASLRIRFDAECEAARHKALREACEYLAYGLADLDDRPRHIEENTLKKWRHVLAVALAFDAGIPAPAAEPSPDRPDDIPF